MEYPYEFDESWTINILIKNGVFLLGIYLNLLRIKNYLNKFPSIAFMVLSLALFFNYKEFILFECIVINMITLLIR